MNTAHRKTVRRHSLPGWLLLTACSAGTLQAVLPGRVMAQDPGARVLEEVIVTARKREEVLQDTPVAVTAFSAGDLAEAGIANTRDLQESVPGLVFSEMGSKAAAIFIRGVGQKEANTALDPGVGVYINGIYIARTDSQLLDVVDPSSIQVLRGPQGTLFGKNNTGGALLVTTQTPDTVDYSGDVSTRIGNNGRADLKLSGNVPLIEDELAARFSVNTTNLDGYMKSDFDGTEYGDEERLGASARVLWQPTDAFNTDLFYYWSKVDEQGAGLTCFLQNPQGTFNTFSWPGFTGPNAYEQQCNASEKASENGDVTINGPTEFTMESQILGVTLNWEFDDVEVKSITAWSNQSDIRSSDDSDGTDILGVGSGDGVVFDALKRSLDAGFGNYRLPDDEERNQYSQELQLSGTAFDDRLSYTTGVFVAWEDIDNTITGNTVGYYGYSYKADVGFLIPKIIGTDSDLTNESYAAFLQGTYEFTDWYELTLGTRYTTEKREREATLFEADCEAIVAADLVPGVVNTCVVDVLALANPRGFYDNPPTVLPVRLVDEYETLGGEIIVADNGVVDENETWSEWTPTITNAFNLPEGYLADTPLDSALVYFTYSKGFKSGGFEMKGLEISEFEPEKVTNYELGVKIDALDQRIRFNSAIYHMDYDDIQIRITEQGRSFADILLFIDNAGAATIQGFETELTFLPLPNVVLNASTSYTDASYDDFIASDVDTGVIPPVQSEVDRSDEDFAAIPELTYALAGMVILPTPVGVFAPRLSMYYRDSFYTGLDATAWDPEFRDRATIDDVTLWNFRLGYTPPDREDVQLWLYVDNLTDENYFQGGFSNTESLGAGSYVLGQPLSYGIEAAISF